MNDLQKGAVHEPPARMRRFSLLLALLLGGYLTVSLAYTVRLPMIMDEFQGARAVLNVGRFVPYRDYPPYKTVLGYYAQLPFLALGGDLWTRMLAVKLAMAAVTAGVLGFVSYRMRRWLDDSSILVSLAMLLSHSTFLERSAEFRVDMLTALPALIGLSAVLSGAAGAAGALTGLSFLISQKGIYYFIAGGAALVVGMIGTHRRRSEPLIRFSLSAAVVVVAYLAFWGMVAGAAPVLQATFVGPQRVAFDSIYEIHGLAWSQTLQRNPGFYLWALLSLFLILRMRPAGDEPRRFRTLAAYAIALTALVLYHKQPWPYFFVLWLPTLFVLSSAGAHVARRLLPKRAWRLVVAILIIGAVLLPLARVPIVLRRDSSVQRRTVLLARQMLEVDHQYLAGVDMVWDRDQPSRDLAWLDLPRLLRFSAAEPSEVRRILNDLRAAPVALIIVNHRLSRLPAPLVSYLRQNFTHWSDCVFVFAPRVKPGVFELPLEGEYTNESSAAGEIDGKPIEPGEGRHLAKGRHVAAGGEFTLRLNPWHAPPPEPQRPCVDLFQNVYGF
ncbi:MAG: hypothetical protein ABR517_11315 [Thermoanaerobaculia bacterium]